jgi:hypothetical protein
MESIEFLKAMLAEMNRKMDATQEKWTPIEKNERPKEKPTENI